MYLSKDVLSLSQIICISYERWEDGAQRIKNLFSELPNVSILYFEPAQPLLSKLRRPGEGTVVAKGITAYTLPCAVPTNEDAQIRLVQRSKKNAAFIRRVIQENGFENPVLWLRSPDQVELMYALRSGAVVYDCDRDWAELPPEWEETIVKEAGLVLSAAPILHDRMRILNDNAVLLPNGVDLSLFQHAHERPETFPADIQQFRNGKPMVGFLGSIGDFTQLAPILHTAQVHPDWNFVFVGEVAKNNLNLRRCRSLPNVHFLGEKAPVSQECYLAAFDLCVSLLDERAPDPVLVSEQLYQYLASGKPIIAMSGRFLEVNYPDTIFYAHTDEEFAASCELALEQEVQKAAFQRILYASEADWKLRRALLRHLLKTNGLI